MVRMALSMCVGLGEGSSRQESIRIYGSKADLVARESRRGASRNDRSSIVHAATDPGGAGVADRDDLLIVATVLLTDPARLGPRTPRSPSPDVESRDAARRR